MGYLLFYKVYYNTNFEIMEKPSLNDGLDGLIALCRQTKTHWAIKGSFIADWKAELDKDKEEESAIIGLA